MDLRLVSANPNGQSINASEAANSAILPSGKEEKTSFPGKCDSKIVFVQCTLLIIAVLCKIALLMDWINGVG